MDLFVVFFHERLFPAKNSEKVPNVHGLSDHFLWNNVYQLPRYLESRDAVEHVQAFSCFLKFVESGVFSARWYDRYFRAILLARYDEPPLKRSLSFCLQVGYQFGFYFFVVHGFLLKRRNITPPCLLFRTLPRCTSPCQAC